MSLAHASRLGWAPIAEVDPELWAAMESERAASTRRSSSSRSENYVFGAVMEAQGSWLTNKYAEGLPGKRYYGGCEFVDIAEDLARERALGAVPGRGARQRAAALRRAGEHGRLLRGPQAGRPDPGHEPRPRRPPDPRLARQLLGPAVRGPCLRRRARTTERIDYDALERQAAEVRPKLIVAGATAYPRIIDFERMAAHRPRASGRCCSSTWRTSPGLVAAGLHPSPFPHADIVTTTTHKTLRGPRGGLIFSRRDLPEGVDRPTSRRSSDLAPPSTRRVFPGVQGGPLMHVIAGQGRRASSSPRPTTSGDDQRRTIENAAGARRDAGRAGRARRLGRHGQPPRCSSTSRRWASPAGTPRRSSTRSASPSTRTPSRSTRNPPNIASGIRVGTPATTTRGFGPRRDAPVGAADRPRRSRVATTPRRTRRSRDEVREIVAAASPCRACPRMTGRPSGRVSSSSAVGSLPLFIARVHRGGVPELAFTPLVPRAWRPLRLRRPARRRRVNTRADPAGGGCGVRGAFLLVGVGILASTTAVELSRRAVSIADGDLVALLGGGALAAVLGLLDDVFQLRARWQLLGQLALRDIAVWLGIRVLAVDDPFGSGRHPAPDPFAIGFSSSGSSA